MIRKAPAARKERRPRRPAALAIEEETGRSTAATADRLHSVAIQLLRRLRREDLATGLSGPRLSALSVVVFAGPLTLGELAAAEQVRPPTMTRLVQGLERGGLVTRRADDRDRRVVQIEATAAGRRTLARGRARRIAALVQRLEALSAVELRRLHDAVESLERVLSRSP